MTLQLNSISSFLVYSQVSDLALADLKKSLGVLNSYLASHTYFVGDSITLADIIISCNLFQGFKFGFTTEFLAEFPHIVRYFRTIENQPIVKKYFGDVPPLDKFPSPPTKQATVAPKKQEEQKPKEVVQKPKEPAPPVDEEEEEKPKPKPKNPLDLLPPSTMVLDEWKRLYSNTKAKDFREVAIAGMSLFRLKFCFCGLRYVHCVCVVFNSPGTVEGIAETVISCRNDVCVWL